MTPHRMRTSDPPGLLVAPIPPEQVEFQKRKAEVDKVWLRIQDVTKFKAKGK